MLVFVLPTLCAGVIITVRVELRTYTVTPIERHQGLSRVMTRPADRFRRFSNSRESSRVESVRT